MKDWLKSWFIRKKKTVHITIDNKYLEKQKLERDRQSIAVRLLKIVDEYMDTEDLVFTSGEFGMTLKDKEGLSILRVFDCSVMVKLDIYNTFPHDKVEELAKDISSLYRDRNVNVTIWDI